MQKCAMEGMTACVATACRIAELDSTLRWYIFGYSGVRTYRGSLSGSSASLGIVAAREAKWYDMSRTHRYSPHSQAANTRRESQSAAKNARQEGGVSLCMPPSRCETAWFRALWTKPRRSADTPS